MKKGICKHQKTKQTFLSFLSCHLLCPNLLQISQMKPINSSGIIRYLHQRSILTSWKRGDLGDLISS